MKILINNTNGQPIYDQIYTQIRDQILNETLKEDEALPSIRGLAKELRISFITTKRAYEELERDGFIYTLPAKGSYVSRRNYALLKEEYLRQIEESIEHIQKLSVSCGLHKSDIHKMIDELWGGEENERD
ncbi:MAG: GntR family transcriptional regulator [Solobacterium sp.]|nr:GntR family transcriptional regulator [Solobacterium sp.]